VQFVYAVGKKERLGICLG